MDTIINENKPHSGKKTFVHHISDKELVSKIHIHRTLMMHGENRPLGQPDKLWGGSHGGPYKLRDRN